MTTDFSMMDTPKRDISCKTLLVPQGWHPDVVYIRALSEVAGIGHITLKRLLGAAGSGKSVWDAPVAFLEAHLSVAKRENLERRREKGIDSYWLETWHAGFDRWQALPIGLTDPRYPPLLKEVAQPPPILYVRGEPDALSVGRMLAFVGTRKISPYGRRVTKTLVADLKTACPAIISGLAAGIDTEAHTAALENGLPTIAVFGCGLDIIYPSTNRPLAERIIHQGGALVSEYGFGTPPSRTSFPSRNRIVAGLCHGTIIVEGDLKSGAMITARMAAEEGRSVFAIPGNIFDLGSRGPNQLLKSGAIPVETAQDIVQDLGWETTVFSDRPVSVTKPYEDAMMKPGLWTGSKPSEAQSRPFLANAADAMGEAGLPDGLPPDERSLLSRMGTSPVAIDVLQQALDWTAAKMGGLLTLLELEEYVEILPGARVCRIV